MEKLFLLVAALSAIITIAPSLAKGQTQISGAIVKMDAALDAIVPADSKLEMLEGTGFEGGEGPVWVQDGRSGYLLFSDIPGNRIYKWLPDCFSYPCPKSGKLSVFLEHAGYKDASHAGSNGTNGLTLDRQHRLLMDATGEAD
jgi:gluconolactonase